jgi:hypothetical protein
MSETAFKEIIGYLYMLRENPNASIEYNMSSLSPVIMFPS